MESLTKTSDLEDDDETLVNFTLAASALRGLLALAARDYISAKVAKKIRAEAAELALDIAALKAKLEARISALQADHIARMIEITNAE